MDESTPLKGHRQGCCRVALRVRCITALISIAEGYDIGVINGAVLLFQDELNLRAWQVGVVLSIFPFSVAICAPMAGKMSDTVGRKPTMIFSSVLLIIGGALMSVATSFETLALGRVFAGSGVGVGLTAVTAYMAEVAPANERGFYASLEELFVNVGNVVGYATNALLVGYPNDWRIMLGLGVPPAFIVMVILLLPQRLSGIPESPRFLERVGRKDEARAVLLELLDGDEAETERAFQTWAQDDEYDGMASWSESIRAFCGSHRKMAVAGIGVGVLNMFTGIMLMMVTTSSLLVGTGMSKKHAMWTTMGLGSTKAFVMLIVALFFLDNWGRRPLLFTSLGVCVAAATVGGIGGMFALHETFAVVGLCLFVTGYSIGVGPVPWVYMPEVLESRLRSKGCALGIAGARLCAATQLLLFPILFPIYGLTGLFLFLIVVNLLGFAHVAAFCPETKELSLEESRQLFSITLRKTSTLAVAEIQKLPTMVIPPKPTKSLTLESSYSGVL